MSILEIKEEIKSEIDKVNDERLLEEILKLLHRDEDEIPDWHLSILKEREEKYGSSDEGLEDWDEVEKEI
jgi:hypothetical protein